MIETQSETQARPLMGSAATPGSGRRFPLLKNHREKLDHPKSIPWEIIAPHAEQAYRNHNQTLERLAERGGLSVVELWHVMSSKRLYGQGTITDKDACDWLAGVLSQNTEDLPTPATTSTTD